MSESIELVKANPLLPAEDYEALRKQGFLGIERLSSDTWTEYNNSDPGITILEAVCYAITDLAYRTGFAVKDLLAPENLTEETWKNIFYTARQILHNNPLTINDYRKLIIDVKGVRNAWLEISKDYEVPLWADYNYYEQRRDTDCGCEDKESKGCYGKLGAEPVDMAAVNARNEERLGEIAALITKNDELIAEIQKRIDELETKINSEPDLLAKMNFETELEQLKKKKQRLEKINSRLEKEKAVLATQTFVSPKIVELEGLYKVMIEYEENVLEEEQREIVRQRVIDRLLCHRNLCEDFLSITAVDYFEFGIQSSIVLEEYADPDAILAEIFFRIYKYFTPSIPFNTIQQMMDKGYTVDEIFEGPALDHGFVETSQLEKTDLFRDIRLSDIINEIADIKGIKAVTHFFIPYLGEESEISDHSYFTEWLQLLKEERKIARVNPKMSFVLFCKEHEFISYYTGRPGKDRDPGRMLKMFEGFKKQERNYKLKGHDQNFPVPAGEYMELEDYYPVTYSLPMCYGVSERAGLPSDADEKRKIQALQLKGYLLFFEQVLSDYLVQLDHLRDLFSFDDIIDKTYFTRALTEIEGLQSLIIDHADRGEDHFDEILNDFRSSLHNIVEPSVLFYKRRNRFLDHMLARFSESMEEYELINRWLIPVGIEQRLISDKARILKDGDYYKISTDRARAYNYSLARVWDTHNISGAELRIGRLLGFSNSERRSLAPDFITYEHSMVLDETTNTNVPKKNKKGELLNIIKIADPADNSKTILTSVEVIDGCCTESLINEILSHADDRRYFKFNDTLKQRSRKSAGVLGSFSFELWDSTNEDTAVLLATSEKFDSREQRDAVFEQLQKIIESINWNEGLHLVEHLLLRPKFDAVYDEAGKLIPISFPDICLDTCDLEKNKDVIDPPPYKKRITRIQADKCYDKMPWILEYLGSNSAGEYVRSILFKETFGNNADPVFLKFRRYETLTKRIKDLYEYGSELINYCIVDNSEDVDDPTVPGSTKYSFKIHDGKKNVLAQSPYVYNKRTKKQIEDGTEIPDDIEKEIESLMAYFEFEIDLYCDPNPCDNKEDPFSSTCTIVLPCWLKRFRDPTFRNFVEKTIQAEIPAHIHAKVKWIGIEEMRKFEKVYFEWLREMASTEMPAYEFVNPLVDKLNDLVPCGCCHDDCGDTEPEKKPQRIKR